MRRLTLLIALAMLVPMRAPAHTGELTRRCVAASAPAQACSLLDAAEQGLARDGISYADATSGDARVDIVDFAFRSRLTVVRDRQMVEFRNVNPEGGNPHSLASDDTGGANPVLPIPVFSAGGGHAFRSGRLLPGEPFFFAVNMSTLDPRAYVVLPNGDALISFHCYIHGASQMSGQILVKNAAT